MSMKDTLLDPSIKSQVQWSLSILNAFNKFQYQFFEVWKFESMQIKYSNRELKLLMLKGKS